MTHDAPIDAPFAPRFVHRLRFTRDAFDPSNPTLANMVASGGEPEPRVLGVFDRGLLEHWPDLPERLAGYAAQAGLPFRLAAGPVSMPGGEAVKSDQSHVDELMRAIHDARLCRRSFVLAVGGGAVLDAAGYAAALAHRGVRLIRIPSTTLSQGDSGVGVKNGINAFGKKNWLGVFAPPWGVVNDESLLCTLTDRDWRAGLSEAVKVALVKDAALFERVESSAPRLSERDESALIPILRRSAVLHLRHITEGGDPFEHEHARPLDFGHWAAHRLEAMSGFRLNHGEAVAAGVALDTLYSANVGTLNTDSAERVLVCLESLGFEIAQPLLDSTEAVLAGIEEFREHLGGRLTISLLSAIGTGYDAHEIEVQLMARTMRQLRGRAAEPRRAAG